MHYWRARIVSRISCGSVGSLMMTEWDNESSMLEGSVEPDTPPLALVRTWKKRKGTLLEKAQLSLRVLEVLEYSIR